MRNKMKKIEMCDMIIWDYSLNKNLKPPDGIGKCYYFVNCDVQYRIYISGGDNNLYNFDGFISMHNLVYREYDVKIGEDVYYNNSLHKMYVIYPNGNGDELLCTLKDYSQGNLSKTVSIKDVYSITKYRSEVISCILK